MVCASSRMMRCHSSEKSEAAPAALRFLPPPWSGSGFGFGFGLALGLGLVILTLTVTLAP